MFDYWLTMLILFPMLGAILAFMMGSRTNWARAIAVAFSAIPLVITLFLFTQFNMGGGMQFEEQYVWISTALGDKAFTIYWSLGVDGLSLPMVLLTTLVTFIAVVFSWDVSKRGSQYFALLLAMNAGVMGVFMSMDYFLFYIFWEFTLIPMFFLIAIWGGPRKAYSSIKFFIYTHVASLAMLLSIFALFFEASTGNFLMKDIAQVAPNIAKDLQLMIFAGLFIGFAVKMPVVPFHTWLPDAHVEAPTAGSVLLAAVMLKMGAYGLIRIALPNLPVAALEFQMFMFAIAAISIVYATFACLAQTDLKKMVAFSSVGHMGFVMLGIATLTPLGLTAASFQMFAHGLITAVLFMACGVIQHSAGTREIPLLGGLAQKMPNLSAFMMIGFMASLGLPSLVGFVSEFATFLATYQAFGMLVWVVLISVPLTAAYHLWAMQRSIFGPLTDKIDTSHLYDVHWYEAAALGTMCLLLLVFGVFPGLIWDYFSPYANELADLISSFASCMGVI